MWNLHVKKLLFQYRKTGGNCFVHKKRPGFLLCSGGGGGGGGGDSNDDDDEG